VPLADVVKQLDQALGAPKSHVGSVTCCTSLKRIRLIG